VKVRYTAQAREHIASIYSYGLPYIIVYPTGAADSDEVLILGVFHGAQDRERE